MALKLSGNFTEIHKKIFSKEFCDIVQNNFFKENLCCLPTTANNTSGTVALEWNTSRKHMLKVVNKNMRLIHCICFRMC